jgi:demethylmenaquinone methyltransferase/2-methoxy-6-polyprenyl-1,4-benzoquinol methylase
MSMKDRSNPTLAPPRLGELNVEEYLNDPARRQAFVTPMFDVIAPRYDAFTKLFSFGMDAGWKKEAVQAALAHASDAHDVLDLACGTGDFVVALATSLASANVLGIDASPRMVAEADERFARMTVRGNAAEAAVVKRMHVRVGDMMQLDSNDASIDLVTAGYGFRNVPDAVIAVREVARVLRRGGTFVTLDFYRPELLVWRKLLLGYLTVAGNTVGWLWHRDPVVYGYIARSIDHFMSWQAFSALLDREGFQVQHVVRHLGGGIALHVATRR